MGTDLLALGVVAIVVGSFLFYKMKAMVAAHATGQDAPVASARARAIALLAVGALLTLASIPANLLASTATAPAGGPGPAPSAASSSAPSAEPSASSSAPSPATAAPSSAPTATSRPPQPRTPGKPPPVRKK